MKEGKGYGLALMVEMLCGVLTGASFGPGVGQVYVEEREREGGGGS